MAKDWVKLKPIINFSNWDLSSDWRFKQILHQQNEEKSNFNLEIVEYAIISTLLTNIFLYFIILIYNYFIYFLYLEFSQFVNLYFFLFNYVIYNFVNVFEYRSTIGNLAPSNLSLLLIRSTGWRFCKWNTMVFQRKSDLVKAFYRCLSANAANVCVELILFKIHDKSCVLFPTVINCAIDWIMDNACLQWRSRINSDIISETSNTPMMWLFAKYEEVQRTLDWTAMAPPNHVN